MVFCRWLFRLAGIYGLVMLVPLYFLEQRLGRDFPPAINHPEYFYGFVGVAIAWQFGFLVIGQNPARYRLFMLPVVVEKFSFGIAAILLFLQDRIAAAVLSLALVDFTLGVLFLVAFI